MMSQLVVSPQLIKTGRAQPHQHTRTHSSCINHVCSGSEVNPSCHLDLAPSDEMTSLTVTSFFSQLEDFPHACPHKDNKPCVIKHTVPSRFNQQVCRVSLQTSACPKTHAHTSQATLIHDTHSPQTRQTTSPSI